MAATVTACFQLTQKGAAETHFYTYDLDTSFYRLFLDKNMQYTCGYFPKRNETLEEAQEEKMLHLASKLLLKPGMKVLDIGCGWGNLAVFLARLESVVVHGLTLSGEQLQDAERLAQENRLADRVQFFLRDYRHERERYDRIVSVGMFEHVGAPHHRAYFKQVHDLLTEDGVAVVHFIGRMEPPSENAAWLNKYIFPGSYAPALSEVMSAVEKQRLFVTDIEVWRQHYPPTLAAWRQRLHANWEQVKTRFRTSAECGISTSLVPEAAFRQDTFLVFQMQLARRMDATPLTRDYIEPWKDAHRISALLHREPFQLKFLKAAALQQTLHHKISRRLHEITALGVVIANAVNNATFTKIKNSTATNASIRIGIPRCITRAPGPLESNLRGSLPQPGELGGVPRLI